MQNIIQKFLLIVVVIGLCAWGVTSKELRLGKDLRGGMSLIYAINFPEDEDIDRQAVIRQVIEVLKDRVNPTGVLDISMEPLGNDRIEIIMPLPNEEVQELRDTYKSTLDSIIDRARITPFRLDEAIASGDSQRFLGIEPNTVLGIKLAAVDLAAVTVNNRMAEYERLQAENAPRTEINIAEAQLAAAQVGLESAKRVALQSSLAAARLERMLRLSNEPVKLQNEDGSPQLTEDGTRATGPSPRQVEIDAIVSDYDHLASDITTLMEEFEAYEAQRAGLDDPADLKRLLRGAGVLEFRIAVEPNELTPADVETLREELAERGPAGTTSRVAKWYEIHDLKQWYDSPAALASLQADPETFFLNRQLIATEYQGSYYLLLYITPEKEMVHSGDTSWTVQRAFPTTDSFGRQAVGFKLDQGGGRLMGRLSAQNLQKPMAIVLDDRVFAAPNLNSQIIADGIIQGTFSDSELSYLIRVLAAGALEARLSENPIAENTLGPSLGKENLDRGLAGFQIAIIAVAIFMIVYYFFAGIVANIALAANGIIIFGFMVAIDGTFTLPGMAGIVLTIGMAVDANVLIYERIREELMNEGLDLRSAIRQGYAKAMSTIFDANVTNLIVCFVLAKTATTEVKGFALTLSIGICATLFTALFVTRQIYYLYTDLFKARKLTMLPTAVPAIHRLLEPKVNWMSLRPVFWIVSIVAVAGSLTLVMSRGVDMLDTELRGGVSATMATARIAPEDPTSEDRIQLRQEEVERTIVAMANDEYANAGLDVEGYTAEVVEAVRKEFANAAVITVGDPETDNEGKLVSDEFKIKVSAPKDIDENIDIKNVVVAFLTEEFGSQLDVTPELHFAGRGDESASRYSYRIDDRSIATITGRPALGDSTFPQYDGGSIFLVEQVDPPTTIADVEARIDRMRSQPDFSDAVGRTTEIIGYQEAGTFGDQPTYNSFAVIVHDPQFTWRNQDADNYYERFEAREWKLLSTALGEPPSLDQVSTFSSAVAQTLKANAAVAVILSLLGILVYIWVRFGSLRYSLAAIAALAHDVSISLGLLGATAIVGGTAFGAMLGIEEFRIDLGVVAALLTIIGYSLNDTIVILDRIRENRGKRPVANVEIVNRSINQCFSRTILTSVTTIMAVVIMYSVGGSGIRPFTFCLLAGLIVGTYSSVAIASPLVVKSGSGAAKGEEEEEPETSSSETALPEAG